LENFPRRANNHQPTTIHHAIHHNFTKKTTQKTPTFPALPSKNAHKTPKTTLSRRPQFFMK
jgi:hypothetical protein